MEWQLGSMSSSLLHCPRSPLLWSPGNRKQWSWPLVCGALGGGYVLLTTGIRLSAPSDKKWGRCFYQQQPPEVISSPEYLNLWQLRFRMKTWGPRASQPQQNLWYICSLGISKKWGTLMVLHSFQSMHMSAGSARHLLIVLQEYLIWLARVWAACSLPHCSRLRCTAEYLRVLSEVRFWCTLGAGS